LEDVNISNNNNTFLNKYNTSKLPLHPRDGAALELPVFSEAERLLVF